MKVLPHLTRPPDSNAGSSKKIFIKMKMSSCIIQLIGVLALITQSQAQNWLTNGLVAYYPFNGNANDESGNENNGTLNGVIFSERRSGQQAAFFDGVTSYVNIPHSDSFNFTNQCTVAVWIENQSPVGQYRSIVSKENNDNYLPHFKFQISPQGPLDFYVSKGAAVGSQKLDGWKHYVAVGDQSSLRLYVDGVLESSVVHASDFLVPNQSDLTIGRLSHYEPRAPQANPWMYFLGKIDDVRIYNRALSDAEVKSLFEYESAPQNGLPRLATATLQIINGFVVGTTITDGGSGYTTAPIITISGGGGTGARAVATVEGGVVTGITILNPGSGYTSTPTLAIASPPFPPRQATGTTEVFNGFVVGVKIVDGGYGYTTPPSVLVVGGGGTGATATATVTDGVVTGITLTSNGSGYTSAPTLQLATPPFDPELLIEVSRVNVRLKVVVGARYQLESSTDMTVWTPTGPSFIAEDAELIQEFVVESPNRYFRIKQVP